MRSSTNAQLSSLHQHRLRRRICRAPLIPVDDCEVLLQRLGVFPHQRKPRSAGAAVNKQHDWISDALGTNENPLPGALTGTCSRTARLFGYRRMSILGVEPGMRKSAAKPATTTSTRRAILHLRQGLCPMSHAGPIAAMRAAAIGRKSRPDARSKRSLFRRPRAAKPVYPAGPRGGRSCGKFGTRAPLFPQWHRRDLGNPLITAL
jgi:hypothetical protein